MGQFRILLAGWLASTAVMPLLGAHAQTSSTQQLVGPGSILAVTVPSDTTVTLVGGTKIVTTTSVPLGGPYGTLATAIAVNGADRAVILDTAAFQTAQPSFADTPITLNASGGSAMIVNGGSAELDPGTSAIAITLQNTPLSCCRFDGHRDKVFSLSWRLRWSDGSLVGSSRSRRFA